MASDNFSTTLLVPASLPDVFNAYNNVRGWWSEEVKGITDKSGEEWTYHYKDDHSCKMRIIELVPNQRVVWLVLENHFSFMKTETEWIGDKIIAEFSSRDGQTQLIFTQVGLVPETECFEACRGAWTNYIQNSLKQLILTGKGKPNPKES